MSESHVLYRLLGADGTLLYVGITGDIGRRLRQHEAGKGWWEDVANVRMERHPDRVALEEAERVAIERERPVYNLRGRPRRLVNFRLEDRAVEAVRQVADADFGGNVSDALRRIVLEGLYVRGRMPELAAEFGPLGGDAVA